MTPQNTVYLPRIGRSILAAQGETVLQAALAAGISYPHGCRMGRPARLPMMIISVSRRAGRWLPTTPISAHGRVVLKA
ncbi:MAG: 2Fe-2S iron-sulfur cluster-binding protein [Rhizobium oryzihabitans]